jgi:preprotein translocase subunit SecA
MSILSKLFGSKSDRDIKTINPFVQQIQAVYPSIEKLSNDELRGMTLQFKAQIAEAIRVQLSEIEELKASVGDDVQMDVDEKEKVWEQIDELEKQCDTITEKVLEEILPAAFAVVKETARRFKEYDKVEVTATDFDHELAARRDSISIVGTKAHWNNKWMAGGNLITWDMVHYDVQLIGGIVLHQGKISEMGTGEGKTLVATLPVYLNALPGKGVHIVTVNDYLAKRDAEWMGVLYEFHGLRVDCIDKHEPHSPARRAAYLADITYGTNNEFGFDYLRDNMATHPHELVQRKHNYSIVDEVDSVLIDDARTPLIISGPTPKGDKQEFDQLKPIVSDLYNAQKNLVTKILADAKRYLTEPNNEANEKQGAILLFRSYRGLPKNKALIKFLSEPGMKTLLQKTENTFMAEQSKRMPEIDDELFFVIDEKNNSIDLTEKGIDLVTSRTGDPSFYILPDIGSFMADIDKHNLSAAEKAQKKTELISDYSIKSERVHTINQLLKAYTLFEKDVEYVVMDNKIKIVDEQTGRILEGRRYSDGLHQAIEAKENVKVEAATQTYATITLQNYFRMYRKLAGMTGTAETEAGELWNIYKLDVVVIPTNRRVVRDDREDLVYRTKREKFGAVIDEVADLVSKGRPVLVGTTSVETSELLSRMLTRKGISHQVLNAKLHAREAEIVKEAGQTGTVTIATNMAGRGTDIKLGTGVKEAGGLAIIGTERHESRRVDRQLRGRAGRQGDPGSSQFFVSLEDDLMRLFGSERIAKIMDRLGLKEGEVIQHSMITKSIERAQKKVEENNFGIRKRLLEYDDVMNQQREVIYKKRRHALYGERLSIDVANMMYDVGEQIASDHQESRDFDAYSLELLTNLGIEPVISPEDFLGLKPAEIASQTFDVSYPNYQDKQRMIADQAFPVISSVFENQSNTYENIAIPLSDGRYVRNVVVNLKEAFDTKGRNIILGMEKGVTLQIIDNAWKEHLREMDDLKQSVQHATYEQKDPLLVYKFESFELFRKLMHRINKEIISFLIKSRLPGREGEGVQSAPTQVPRRMEINRYQESRQEEQSKFGFRTNQGDQKVQPVKAEKKVGRNDPCPCGSGKKYKHCHGVNEA